MKWTLPNQLTVARIGLAGAFFVLVGLYRHGAPNTQWLLNTAFVVYIIAGITDILDGWIARRWNLTSAFGRIVDPFVDKVLVVGAFVMLTGSNFAFPAAGPAVADASLPTWLTGRMLSAVQSWMVVTILAREFVVSAVRGYSESQGIKFPANSVGKMKMALRCSVPEGRPGMGSHDRHRPQWPGLRGQGPRAAGPFQRNQRSRRNRRRITCLTNAPMQP